jgi:carbon-monoxide dehydrogenase catalytic subunit
MGGEIISYHESVRRAYDRIKEDGMSNIWDRYQAQGTAGNPDQRCPFCTGGVRCDLCSNGPRRADVARHKRGVCGITGDGVAMRMMLLRNILGASTYHYHPEQTIKTLRATARGETPFTIIEKDKLKVFGGRLGISASSSASPFCAGLLDIP